MRKGLFILGLFLVSLVHAQTLTIDNQSHTAQQLVEDVLVISCTPITNVNATGDTTIRSYGYFHRNAGSTFPFDEGVYLTTGSSEQIVDPNYGSGIGAPTMSYGTTAWGSDADIEAELGNANMINATVLEFDFIPTVSNISFDYLMLSEEYHGEYPCSYADGFAFLIKPVGAATYQNIAVVPGTTTPVAVTTVHPTLSDNGVALSCGASNAGYFDNYYPLDTNFNGRTTVLTASTAVTPNQQYHIKLVVADATGNANPDTSFDTAIFLKARGLNLGSVAVDIGPEISICQGEPNPILDATVPNATAQYQWQVFDAVSNSYVDIVGATNPTYEVTSTGLYQVLLDVDGCLSDDHALVTISEVPVATQPQNLELCDADDDGFMSINLHSQDTQILNGQDATVFTVNYYEDAALTLPIANANAYNNTTAYQQTIYAQVANIANSSCASNIVNFDIIIYDAPNPLPISDLLICDNNGNGIETFDLTVQNTNLLNGLNAANFTIGYYEDAALTIPIGDPTNYTNTSSPYNQTIYVTIENNTNSACTSTIPFDLIVSNNLPVVQPPDLRECDDDGDGFWIFDLTVQDSVILAGLDPNLYTITYYEDAALTTPVANPNAHQNNPIFIQTIYAQIVNNASPNCNTVVQFDINVYIIPTATVPPDLSACDTDNDGFALFDLTANDDAILNGQDPTTHTVLYYEDAALTQQIANPSAYTNTTAYTQTIYVSATNTELSTCKSPAVSFNIDVYDSPLPIPALSDLRACDFAANGIASFDLTVQDTLILNGQDPAVYSVNYYEDAALTTQIAIPTNYDNTTPNLQTVYVSVVNNSNPNCTATSQFNLIVDNTPVIVQPNPLAVCDDNNDGIWTFDLTTQENTILNNLSSADYTVSYYEDVALTSQIATPANYTNSTAYNQTIYIQVVNNTFAACNNTTTLSLQIADTPTATQPQDMTTCDTDNQLGVGTGVFDLTSQDTAILNGQDPATFSVNYYTNPSHTALINTPTAYNNTTGGALQTIYAQVVNNTNAACAAETTFTLQTFDAPAPPTVTPDFKNCDNDNDGFQTVDLTAFTPELLNGQDPASFHVDYYTDAALTNLIATPNAFANTTAYTQTLYAVIYNVNNTTCTLTVPFDLKVYNTPQAFQANDVYLCNDGRSASFDLSVQIPTILNGQVGMLVSFHGSQADADAGINPLANPFIATVNAGPFTVFVRVENQGFSSCADTSITFTIEAFEAPQPPTTLTPVNVCDDNNDGFFTFDLPALKDAEILNGQNAADFTIRYYTDAALTNEIVVPNAFTNTVIHTQRIWIKMANNNYTGCDQTRFFDLNINDFPTATQPPNLEQCDDDTTVGVGNSVFDLTVQNTVILNGQDSNTFEVHYYTDAALTAEILAPNAYANTTGSTAETIYVAVYNTNYTVCSATTSFTIQTFDTSNVPNAITPIAYCDDDTDGLHQTDLTQKATEILNGYSAVNFEIHYYTDSALTNEIIAPTAYLNTTPYTETIYIKVLNSIHATCESIGSFELKIYSTASATQPPNLEQCDDDTTVGVGNSVFDLTTQNATILNGQDSNTFEVHYYTDAALTAEIMTPAAYTNTTGSTAEPIYVAVYNTNYTVCSATTSFTIQTFDTPNVPAVITPLAYCDDDTDGLHQTDLTQKSTEILNGYSAAAFEVHYYTDSALTNEITTPTTYLNTTPFTETIYVKVMNSIHTACESIGSFTLNINPIPTVTSYNTMLCDEDGVYDNYTTIDLTQFQGDLTSTLGVNFYYYTDNSYTNLIADPTQFVNTLFNQTIYVQVENATTLCTARTTLSLVVSSANAVDSTLTLCDDLVEDGFTTFDLTQSDASILATMLPGAPTTLKRYLTYGDALNQTNEYTATTYTNTANPQDIYVRVTSTINPACFSIATLHMEVYSLPDVVLEDVYYLCLDTGSVAVSAIGVYSTYGWYDENDILLGNASTQTFTSAGNYYLQVSDANGCEKRTNFSVEISESPEITAIAVVDLSLDNTLTVTAVGAITGDPLAAEHFEYALDDGPFQSSNVFHNVHGGWRLLRVRDIQGCGEVTQRVMVLDYPKFFTPNNDGYNDTWHLFGHEHVDGIEVYIYDRFGKLLKIIYQYDLGWDGQYNGNPLPATDYWFRLKLRDGSTFRSHFSLIR